jgi:hypothetical protein
MTGELENSLCPTCGGQLHTGVATVPSLLSAERVAAAKGVPAEICGDCHEPFMRSKVTNDIMALINYPAASYGVSNGKNTAWARSKLRGIAPCKGLSQLNMLGSEVSVVSFPDDVAASSPQDEKRCQTDPGDLSMHQWKRCFLIAYVPNV